MTDMGTSQALAEDSEIALLRALAQEQLAQITDLTRRLAKAQNGASADPQLLRAGLAALERRLQDTRAVAQGREAALAAQLLADGEVGESPPERNVQPLRRKSQSAA